MAEILIGMLSVFVGAAINNLGIVLQKRQINLKEGKGQGDGALTLGDYLRDPIWVLGIIMQTLLVWPFFVFGLSLVGVTLAQPLSNSGIIILIVGLIYFVNERLNRSEGFGAILLISGVIAIGVGGVVGEVSQQSFLNETSILYFLWFLVLIVILLVALIILMIFVRVSRPAILGLVAGICYAVVSISMQVFTIALEDLTSLLTLLLFAFGLTGTVIGTVFGILTTQEAFKQNRAVSVIPFMQITMNLIPILAGIWVFNQQITQPLFFWTGIICIMTGASLLARFQE
ncbi:MAG: hypothetical protein ACFFF4_13120 [Candidatus Thorarchaeota archaeon]